MQVGSFAASAIAGTAMGRRALTAILSRTSGPAGGPDETERAKVRGLAVAVARDDAGRVLAEVEVDGPSPYTVTAELMAVAAQRLAGGLGQTPGVVGPMDALGEDGFASLCDEVGLHRVR